MPLFIDIIIINVYTIIVVIYRCPLLSEAFHASSPLFIQLSDNIYFIYVDFLLRQLHHRFCIIIINTVIPRPSHTRDYHLYIDNTIESHCRHHYLTRSQLNHHPSIFYARLFFNFFVKKYYDRNNIHLSCCTWNIYAFAKEIWQAMKIYEVIFGIQWLRTYHHSSFFLGPPDTFFTVYIQTAIAI